MLCFPLVYRMHQKYTPVLAPNVDSQRVPNKRVLPLKVRSFNNGDGWPGGRPLWEKKILTDLSYPIVGSTRCLVFCNARRGSENVKRSAKSGELRGVEHAGHDLIKFYPGNTYHIQTHTHIAHTHNIAHTHAYIHLQTRGEKSVLPTWKTSTLRAINCYQLEIPLL